MASSPTPAPTTPNTTPRRLAMNRSATLPPSSATKGNAANDTIETLFVHPNANVVKFTAASPAPRAGSSPHNSPSRPGSSAGTIPWMSPTERPLAAGPLEIYRVRGMATFLHSGNLIHTIMSRSQCWCVDGVSKFALRVFHDTYYRIELPGRTEEDMQKVEELKLTLQKTLFYERSACPFARTFGGDLPEMPDIKKRRRQKSTGPAKKWMLEKAYSWRPEDGEERRAGAEESGSGESDEPSSLVASEDEDSAILDDSKQAEDVFRKSESAGGTANPSEAANELGPRTPARSARVGTLRSVTAPSQLSMHSSQLPPSVRTNVRVDGAVEAIEHAEGQARSNNSNTPTPNRTRTIQAIPIDMPPSPPDSSAGLEYMENNGQQTAPAVSIAEELVPKPENFPTEIGSQEEITEAVVGVGQPDAQNETLEDEQPGNVAEIEQEKGHPTDAILSQSADPPTQQEEVMPLQPDFESEPEQSTPVIETEVIRSRTELTTLSRQRTPEDPYAAIQARILARRSIGGTTSFHPSKPSARSSSSSASSSTATISSSISRRSNPQQQHAFASALVKKTCSTFLGPPAHLVAIMLRIAARIANGAFGINSMFYVESPPGSSRRVPGSFFLDTDDIADLATADDDDDDDDGNEGGDWEEDEDDFGVPLRNPVRLARAVSEGDGLSLSHLSLKERTGWELD